MKDEADKYFAGWHPGLETDHLTVAQVMATLKGDPPGRIPWRVRLLENPSSPLCMPGGSSLERHDPLHAILACGTSKAGECFVIGYSMGAASATRPWHLRLFKWWLRWVNPKLYRMGPEELEAFDRGVALSREVGKPDVHLIPLETMTHKTVGELRALLGLTTERLRQEPLTAPQRQRVAA